MIDRSTNIKAALRSRQRGFLLNPFNFGGASASDPYFSSVTALLHFNGANGSTAFTDQKGGAWTRTGAAQISTDRSKFGASSLKLAGASDSISRSYVSSLFEWWSASFTIECWVYLNSYPGVGNIVGNMDSATPTNYWCFGVTSAGKVDFYYYNGAVNNVTGTAIIPLATWTHIMMTHEASTSKIRVGSSGVIEKEALRTGVPQSSVSYPLRVGLVNSIGFNGFIDDMRITRGVARDHSVPTAAFPDS